jgi:outer membrane autotransporter protein
VDLGFKNVYINEKPWDPAYSPAIGAYDVFLVGGFLDGNDPKLIQALINATLAGGIDEQIVNRLSPEVHRGMVDYTEQAMRTHIREGLDAAPISKAGKAQVFATAHASTAGSEATNTNASYDTEMFGATIGVRYDVDNRFQLGGIFGADAGTIEGNLIDTDAQGLMFGLFGRYLVHEASKTVITASLSFGTFDYDSDRHSYGGSAKANGISSDAFDMSLGVRTVSFESGGFRMIPNATVRYLTGSVDSFVEDGGSGVRLRVEEQEIDSLLLDLGVDLEYQVQQNFTLVGNVGYVTDFIDSDNSVSAAFAASGGYGRGFTVHAPGIDDEGLVLGLGAYYDINDSSRLGVTYRCDFRKNSDISQTIGIGASFGF